MKFLHLAIVLSIFAINIQHSQSFKILGIMPVAGRSHYYPFAAIMEGLAAKGHQVTFLTPFEPKTPLKNLDYVTIQIGTGPTSEVISIAGIAELFGGSSVDDLAVKVFGVQAFLNVSQLTCDTYMSSKEVLEFRKRKQHFDVVITEAFMTDCWNAFAYEYKAPLVHFTASMGMAWINERFGQPDNPSYINNVWSGFTPEMTFWQRMQNGLMNLYQNYYYEHIQEPINDGYVKNVFGDDIPSRQEIASNAALLLMNTHFSLFGAKPTVPGVVEVGGIHITKEPKKLPENIEKWINESKDGVIYFSMGSVIKGSTFPDEKRNAFLKAFGRLKQRVLWKYENETMPNQPANVMIQKWMPQYDILCHPNVKAFISHGGLLGTTEALTCGVPVVVMPQFGDQLTNAQNLERVGGGVYLNYAQANEETLYNALTTVLDPEFCRFNKNAKELSARFRDRPMKPMETAIYWIEYVARHKGAPHLRTAAVGMPLYQYLLLDVFGFIALCVLAVILINVFLIKLICRAAKKLIFGAKKEKKQKKH